MGFALFILKGPPQKYILMASFKINYEDLSKGAKQLIEIEFDFIRMYNKAIIRIRLL
jgi:hypothetical protein